MANREPSAFTSLYGTSGSQFPDNTTGLITETIVRAFGQDIADSLVFRLPPQSVSVISDVTLNCKGSDDLVFYNAAAIGGARTWSLTNSSNAKKFTFLFEISGGLYVQTMPASFIMSDVRWDDGAKTWTPIEQGKYKAVGLFDGTNWFLEISPSTYL